MSKILCTFPGKFGDILWSLATVKEISKQNNCKVDFLCMSAYKSLLPLLSQQPYIDNAAVNGEWICTGSPHGDQPWSPQNAGELEWEYDKVYHLGYRYHPGIHGSRLSLIDFIADQQGLKLTEPVLPFIELRSWEYDKSVPIIGYAFNPEYPVEKSAFFTILTRICSNIIFLDVGKLPWIESAVVIKNAVCYVGDKSSNHVLAFAVGQKNIFIYEPHPHKNINGPFGHTFTCPYLKEQSHPLGMNPEKVAEIAASNFVNIWKFEKEHNHVAV